MLKNDSIALVHIKLLPDIAARSAMRNLVWIILLVAAARAQEKYKLCAPVDVITDSACFAIQRGDVVSCLRVADSAECAIRLAEGEADFGIFNAEELLLASQFYPSNIDAIIQLKHKDRQLEEFEFQTVAVIPAELAMIELSPDERLKRLKGAGFCHPGFSKSQRFNDYILKFFENSVNTARQCQDNVIAIENEIINLRNFFGKACRPGEWAADDSIDQELKKKYPELCALCDNKTACRYNDGQHHGHFGALDCLNRGHGKVAYVALQYVQEYFKKNDSYQFLCPSGITFPLYTPNPCTWINQPWSVIAARNEIADSLKPKLLKWIENWKADKWTTALSKIILEGESWIYDIKQKMTIGAYMGKGRNIDVENIQTCGKSIRWCTIGDPETDKCMWVAKEAKALGVEPSISCIKSNSTFQCFHDIDENRTDIVVIDSTYGYLARTVYNLSTILYSETEMDKNSVILAVMREPKDDNFPVKGLLDLKDKRACFPEYGGLSWLSFINVTKTNSIISHNSCDYPLLASRLLSGACIPGIKDSDHSVTAIPSDVTSILCSVCKNENNPSCAANETNRYYGDKGALQCIDDGAGDIAFIDVTNIAYDDNSNIDSNMYRVFCQNGSFAQTPGLNVDKLCALSETIDSEVVGKKNATDISRTNTVLALLKLEDWLGYRVSARRPIHIYGPFNNTKDLLFKDSSAGLVSTSSTKKSVLAYKTLLIQAETCSTGSLTTANFICITVVTLYYLLSSHVH